MFTKKFTIATVLIVVMGLAGAGMAWLAWPQLTWQPAEQARWTVLTSNPHAQYFPRAAFEHPKQVLSHDPALKVGMQLEPGVRIRNRGLPDVALQQPDGTLLVVPPAFGETVLQYQVPDQRARLAQLRALFSEGGALADAWQQASMPVARYLRAECYVVLAMLLSWLALQARGRAPGPAAVQLAQTRASLLALLAAGTLLWYLLMALLGSLAWLDYFGGALAPQAARPIGTLGAALAWLKPAASLIALAGVFSVGILAWRLGMQGKASLQRSSLWLWSLAGMLVLLVITGTGASYLPFVDRYSNLDALFRQFDSFTRSDATALSWVAIGLLIERGIALPDAAAARLPAAWLLAFVLALLLALAAVARHDPFANVQAQQERVAQMRELYCKASDVVVGQAHGFRIVEEAQCWRYDDGTPKRPDRLGRCQSLEFDVDVIKQLWPLPEPGAAALARRTFRLGGISAPVADLERRLVLGARQSDVNLNDITGPGPRVFYGKAASAAPNAILRNTLRGHMLSDPAARDRPFDEAGHMQMCGPAQALAHQVIQHCRWELAIVVTARRFSIVAADGKSVNRFSATPLAPAGRVAPHPLDERDLQPGEQFEVDLDIVESLEPSQSLPARGWKMRFVAEGKFANLRRLWLDPAGPGGEAPPARKVTLLAREDRTEPGLLHLVGSLAGPETPVLNLESRRAGFTTERWSIAACHRARADYAAFR